MKKVKLKSSIVAGLTGLLLLFPNFKTGSLTEISKPYLGVYECQQAKLGEEEYLDKFSYIELELFPKGKYALRYCEKSGEKQEVKGKYRSDEKKEILTLYLTQGGVFKRDFPLEKGKLTATVPLGNKTLFLQFEQK